MPGTETWHVLLGGKNGLGDDVAAGRVDIEGGNLVGGRPRGGVIKLDPHHLGLCGVVSLEKGGNCAAGAGVVTGIVCGFDFCVSWVIDSCREREKDTYKDSRVLLVLV